MNKTKKRIILTVLSIINFLIAIAFLCACTNSLSAKLLEILKTFKPNLSAEKIAKLRGVLLGNVFLFSSFGVLFILLNFVKFSNEESSENNLFTIMPKFSIRNISRRKYCHIAILFLLFAGISSIRFYWLNQKQTFHMDEIYGISITTQNEYGLWSGKDFEKGREYTGKEIKDAIFFDDDSIKDTAKDLIHLWVYNKDTAYNNLYLYLSRIWFTGFKTSDFKATFIRAGLLNYIFFCFAFYFMYLLLNEFSVKPFTKYAVLLAAFLNPASIGISVFMRSYALQECILILFTYLFVFYYKNIKNRTDITGKKNFLRTGIVCAVLFSTDYFSIFYLAILGIILIVQAARKKNINMILYLLCCVLTGLLFAKCFYLNYGTGFFSGRGAEAFSEIGSSALKGFIYTVQQLNDFITKNIFTLIVMLILAATGVILNIKNKEEDTACSAIFVSSLLFCFFVLYISPLKTLRYIAPAFPLLSLSLIIKTNKKALRYAVYAVQFCFVILTVKNVLPLQKNFSRIEHLNDNNQAIQKSDFIKDLKNPIIISHDCVYPEVLPYLQNNQKVYFADSLEQVRTYNIDTKSFWWVTHIKNMEETRTFSETLIE